MTRSWWNANWSGWLKNIKKAAGRDKAVIEREIELFEKLAGMLGEGKPLRDIALNGRRRKSTISGFGFLKPKTADDLIQSRGRATTAGYCLRHISAAKWLGCRENWKWNLGQLSEEDAEMFMQEYGIEELGLSRMIRASYDLLGLLSFFTVGEDEVRAWTVRRRRIGTGSGR